MGEPHLREPLGVQGCGRRPREQEPGHEREEPARGEGAPAGDAEREEQGAVREPAAHPAGRGRVQDAGDDEAAVVRQVGATRAQGRGRSAQERGAARPPSVQGHVSEACWRDWKVWIWVGVLGVGIDARI
jgi:hypothetical protein